MTFEQAHAELRSKLPAEWNFDLVRSAGRRPEEFFLFLAHGADVPEKTFDILAPGGSLEGAVAAAVDFARCADLAGAENQQETR